MKSLFAYLAVRDERRDPQQDDRADDGRGQAAQRAYGHPSEKREYPASQYAADKSDDQIDEESRAASLDDQVGDPPGRQAEEQIP